MSNITFDTSNVDASVAINALKHYRAREYKRAEACLLEIIDFEPNNWDARLMLAVCYYKQSQMAAALRAFRYIWTNCTIEEIRKNACEGLQATNAALDKQKTPEEFGVMVPRQYKAPAWLEG